jgi:hypothetical protein
LPAIAAGLNGPRGIAVDADGSIYIADRRNQRIRKITPDGIIHTVAGSGRPFSRGDGVPATSADVYYPSGLALGPNHSLFLSESTSDKIRKVDLNTGLITTIAGKGWLTTKYDPDLDEGKLALNAQLRSPISIAVTPHGEIFMVESDISRVRLLTPRADGQYVITTFLGRNVAKDCGSGTFQGTAAQGSLNTLKASLGVLCVGTPMAVSYRQIGQKAILAISQSFDSATYTNSASILRIEKVLQ